MLQMVYYIIGKNKGSTRIITSQGLQDTELPKIYRTSKGVWGKHIYLNSMTLYFWKVEYRGGIMNIPVEGLYP